MKSILVPLMTLRRITCWKLLALPSSITYIPFTFIVTTCYLINVSIIVICLYWLILCYMELQHVHIENVKQKHVCTVLEKYIFAMIRLNFLRILLTIVSFLHSRNYMYANKQLCALCLFIGYIKIRRTFSGLFVAALYLLIMLVPAWV